MRSLKYAAAVLSLPILNALASTGRPVDDSETVVVTQTRTVTICPITDLFECGTEVPDFSTTAKVTTTSTGKSSSLTSTTQSGQITSISSHSGGFGNGTTTSFTSQTTSGFNNGTTTTSATTTSVSTTSSVCLNGTLATEIAKALVPACNSADDRSSFCGKSINADTHETFKTGRTRTFSLVITEAMIDFDGTPRTAFAINGKTPGEPIEANWGDMVEVTVTNNMVSNATTIHWHGITQYGTNDQDGVPGVTECGIAPGQSRKYTWHASTYGTGWYHSHALAQYGGGIRGPIIIHGPASSNYDLDMGAVMVDEIFSDTIFNMAYNNARLRGRLPAATNYLLNGKNQAPGNSTGGESSKWIVKKGKKHLFRIINSSAQTGFAMHIDNHKFTVISADFTPIKPYTTETLWIQSGQRYNVIVDADQPIASYHFRAIAQQGCGSFCNNDGLGAKNGIIEYEGACGATPVAGNFTLTTATDCKEEPAASLVPVVAKDAGNTGKFSASVKLLPGGNAGAQQFGTSGLITRWFLGATTNLANNSATTVGNKVVNVTFSQPTLQSLATLPNVDYNSSIYSNNVVLDGPANDWVYFVIQNNFQTSHPMHLHGHDFSVLGQGRGVFTSGMEGQLNFVNPIRRDTALLFGIGAPGAFTSGWTVIGFKTDNPGAWLMHCHIIWHADGGMGLQYLERPSEIDAGKYYNNNFQNECSAYKSWEAENPEHVKAPYESGLKRRMLDEMHSHVRHSF